MKLQKLLLLPAICLLAFTISACGDDDESSSASSTESSDGIRVAIVAPSAENDLAFSQSIVDGVSKLTGVSETAITPGTFIVEEAATAIRDYAEAGYDLPDTAFAWGTAVDTFGLDNVSAYTAASNEGGYVLGVIAAEVGGNIGIVGPIAVGDAKLYVDGFTLGAESGGAEVSVTYIESFADSRCINRNSPDDCWSYRCRRARRSPMVRDTVKPDFCRSRWSRGRKSGLPLGNCTSKPCG